MATQAKPIRFGVHGLTESWRTALSALEANGGELTPEDEAQWRRLVEATPEAIEDAAMAVRSLEAECDVIRMEINRLRDRASSRESHADRIRALIGESMDLAGERSIRTPRVTVSRIAGRQRVSIVNEAAVPSEYRVPQPDRLDVKAIGDAVKAGAEVPGVEVVTGNPSVSIR